MQNYSPQDGFLLTACAGAIVCLLVYYIAVWLLFGLDRRQRVSPYVYEPPRNLSPAAMRYLLRMEWDETCQAAALVSMAVKRFIRFRKNEHGFSIERDGGAETLSQDEKIMGGVMFPAPGARPLAQKVRGKMMYSFPVSMPKIAPPPEPGSERQGFYSSEPFSLYFNTETREILDKTHLTKYFVNNKGFVRMATAATLMWYFAMISIDAANRHGSVDAKTLKSSLWIFLATVAASYVPSLLFGGLKYFIKHRKRNLKKALEVVGVTVLLAIFPVAIELAALDSNLSNIPEAAVYYLFIVMFMHQAFSGQLRAPNAAGRELIAEIEGFRMYLSASKRDRAALRSPFRKSPELFEKYLPYAVALDVTAGWADHFSGMFKAAEDPRSGFRYSPPWSPGPTFDPAELLSSLQGWLQPFGNFVAPLWRRPGIITPPRQGDDPDIMSIENKAGLNHFIVAIFILLFLMFPISILIVLARSGTIIDRRKKKILRWYGFLIPWKRPSVYAYFIIEHSLGLYSEIVISELERSTKNSSYIVYPARMSGRNVSPLNFYPVSRDVDTARKQALSLHDFLDFPIVEELPGVKYNAKTGSPREVDENTIQSWREKFGDMTESRASLRSGAKKPLALTAGNAILTLSRNKKQFFAAGLFLLFIAANYFLTRDPPRQQPQRKTAPPVIRHYSNDNFCSYPISATEGRAGQSFSEPEVYLVNGKEFDCRRYERVPGNPGLLNPLTENPCGWTFYPELGDIFLFMDKDKHSLAQDFHFFVLKKQEQLVAQRVDVSAFSEKIASGNVNFYLSVSSETQPKIAAHEDRPFPCVRLYVENPQGVYSVINLQKSKGFRVRKFPSAIRQDDRWYLPPGTKQIEVILHTFDGVETKYDSIFLGTNANRIQ